MRIITRAEWGAAHDDGAGPAPLPAEEVFLHHSVTVAPDLEPPFDDDFAAIRTLERIGEERFGRGISYTFPITPAGLVFEGHGVDRKGAHTAGRNSRARAIVFVGNYDAGRPTEQQLDAAAWLLVHGWLSGWWKRAELTGGHRDVSSTACPGRHAYAAIPVINRRAKALADALLNPGDTLDMDGATLEQHVEKVVRRVLDDKTAGRPFALDRIAHAHNYAKGAVLSSREAVAMLSAMASVLEGLATGEGRSFDELAKAAEKGAARALERVRFALEEGGEA